MPFDVLINIIIIMSLVAVSRSSPLKREVVYNLTHEKISHFLAHYAVE